MDSILKPIRRFFSPRHKIPAGVYHYQAPPDDPRNYRLHLRMEENGDGLLIVNAATVLHLNQTAAEYAYYLVQNTPIDEVAQRMSARYHVDVEQARHDYRDFSERIQTLIEVPDLDPVTFLDFERVQPFSGRWSAPLRLDCAITYRLPADEAPDSAPVERVKAELSTDEWMQILDKAWNAGIPHIIFTGGEPTLRDDLVALIGHAEDLGQVSGLLSDGLRLSDRAYLERLLQAGLDHLLLTLQPELEQSWEAVENALVEDLSVIVHLTIMDPDQAQALRYLHRLSNLGVKKISLSTNDPNLADTMQAVRAHAAAMGLELVWNIPVPYSSLHPVAFETGDAQIEGAGRAWLYVEPDGDVLAGQGNPKVLGNFLSDSWEKIWNR